MTEKTANEQVMEAFEEFKRTNDAALAEIKSKGVADPVLTEKLGKVEATLVSFEAANQKATAAALEAKAALDEEKKHVDALEEKFNRLMLAGASTPESKKAEIEAKHNLWARAVVGAATVGIPNLSPDQQKALAEVQAEYKALSVGNDTTGGYLAPMELVREIIKGVTDISPARKLARVRSTSSKAIMIPKRTGQFAAQWVAEQGTKSETDGLRYGMWEIPTHELFALIDISNQNLEDSAWNMASEINSEAVEQFEVAEGAAFVSGNGVGKPQGFLDTGAGLSENISGSAATIADVDGQANGLLTLKYALKTAYARNATWALNRTTLGSVRKLKDAEKNYIWMPGLGGQPNTIDGDVYVEVPDMPSEGAGLYPIAYGDFKRGYTLVDRISMEMLRDPYTQATSGNVRFIFRRRLGGQVVLAEAIRKLKCAAA